MSIVISYVVAKIDSSLLDTAGPHTIVCADCTECGRCFKKVDCRLSLVDGRWGPVLAGGAEAVDVGHETLF